MRKALRIIFQNIWYIDLLENIKVLPGKAENLDEMLKKVKEPFDFQVFLKKFVSAFEPAEPGSNSANPVRKNSSVQLSLGQTCFLLIPCVNKLFHSF